MGNDEHRGTELHELGAATVETCGLQPLGLIEIQQGTFYAIGGIESTD